LHEQEDGIAGREDAEEGMLEERETTTTAMGQY
jgi:hypothetical protein